MRVTSQARDPSRTPPQVGRAQGPDRRAPTASWQGELAGASAVAPAYFAPLLPLAAPLYPKLMVGDAHDPAERAADAFADRVMGGGGAAPAAPMGTTGSGVLRRKCSACEEEDKTLHRKEAAGAGGGGGRWSAPPVVHQALASAGHGLDAGARAQIEARGGVDLSGVRVHTDALAAQSAAAVGARAYTVGRDVVFGAGQYRPGTQDGLRLIAHEVGHLGSGVVRREADGFNELQWETVDLDAKREYGLQVVTNKYCTSKLGRDQTKYCWDLIVAQNKSNLYRETLADGRGDLRIRNPKNFLVPRVSRIQKQTASTRPENPPSASPTKPSGTPGLPPGIDWKRELLNPLNLVRPLAWTARFDVDAATIGGRGSGTGKFVVGGTVGIDKLYILDVKSGTLRDATIGYGELGVGLQVGASASIILGYHLTPFENTGLTRDLVGDYEGQSLSISLKALGGLGFSVSPSLFKRQPGWISMVVSLGPEGGTSASASYGVSKERAQGAAKDAIPDSRVLDNLKDRRPSEKW